MTGLPPQPSFVSRAIVSTIALFMGGYLAYEFGKDFEFVKFEPHSPEEVERRKREHIGLSMKQLETRTLDYTPEAKARLHKILEEKEKAQEAKDEET